MKPLIYILAITLAAATLSTPLPADTVNLRDGRKIVGQIQVQDDPAIVAIETPYGRLEFRASEVEKLDYDIVTPPGDKGTGNPISSTGTGQKPATQADPDTATLSTAERDLFLRATGEADKAMTAAEGLAVWAKFKADHPAGALATLAAVRVALWQKRVDKDQVRFGPTWLGRGEAEARNKLADELLAASVKADSPEEAARLLDKAIAANPYRADLPFAKGARMAKAGGRTPQAVAGFDQALTIAPDCAAAMNNLGVLMARERNWPRALMYLTRAAGLLDNDIALDNLDLVAHLGRQADASRVDLAAVDRQVRQIVDDRHKAKKNLGQTRWGNTWMPQSDLDKLAEAYTKMDATYAANNARRLTMERDLVLAERTVNSVRGDMARFPADDKSAALRELASKMVTAEAQVKALRDEIARLQKENDAMLGKRKEPPHADKLVMLDRDGKTELMNYPIIKDAADVKAPGDKPPPGGN